MFIILTLKCSKCKGKLFKYLKIGKGEVLKCFKDRIKESYNIEEREGYLYCSLCGNKIGIDKGDYFSMISKSFKYKGTKENK